MPPTPSAVARGQPTINNLNLSSMPVQGNYRTNVYGSLLTTQNVFNVEIKPAFVDNYTVVPVSTDTELKAAIESGNSVKLNNDMTITDLNLPVNKPVMIELNNHNLTLNKRTSIAAGQDLTVKGNGTEKVDVRNVRGFEVKSGSLHVEGVTMEDKFDYAKYPNYHSTMVMVIGENAKVDMKDVTLIPNNINTYAFSTDASSTDQNIHINMENVKILPSVIIACPMLCNLPVTFTAKDCVFEGCNQAFIARGGDYTFTNCTFTQTLAFDKDGVMYSSAAFGDYPNRNADYDIADPADRFTGWMLLSYRKPVAVSSTVDGMDPAAISDENMRTYWAARSAAPGEWAMIDLGPDRTVRAIQVNYYEYLSDQTDRADDMYFQYPHLCVRQRRRLDPRR